MNFMNFRRMGDTGIECSVIGLGTGRLASAAGGLSRAAAGRLLGVAEDCGINLIDTADSYAQGECEKTIGAALQGKRSRFIVVTKAGYSFSTLGGGLRLLKPLAKRVLKYFKGGKKLAGNVRANVSRQDFNPVTIENSINASLQRLRTDYLDVFLLHSPPAQVLADVKLFDLLRRLKQEGKIRQFGVSSPEHAVLERALRVPGLAIIQTPVNPVHAATRNLFPEFQKAKIGVIANQIFLSGKLIDAAYCGADEEKELYRLKGGLGSFAAPLGAPLNRLLIEYALSQPGVASILTGTTNPAHLKQNVAYALSPPVLSPNDLSRLEKMEAVVPNHD
jgi:aryl-alcohol dehydrogenase-like predicted oxidoreductase